MALPKDKDVADVIESLTAVSYISGNIVGAIQFLKELGVLHDITF